MVRPWWKPEAERVYLCVSGVLKPMITYGKGRRRRFPAINE
jgi:hypothetical protein